jgi:four helix bundle protein
MVIKSFEDLEVYQLSIKITKNIYSIINSFPAKEKYNIVGQLIRASSSIGANIAEGVGRDTTKEFIKYLFNARGSLMEVRHFLNLTLELNYISNQDVNKILSDCEILGIKLNNLINALKRKIT